MTERITTAQKLLALKRAQWFVILRAPFVLLVTWRRLRKYGYQHTLRMIPPVPGGLSGEEQMLRAKDTAYAFAVAVKFGPWWPKCLLRSLALGWFLARGGVPFQLRIGVPSGQARLHMDSPVDFSAHAWVEHAGVVLNDRKGVAGEFAAFESGTSDSGLNDARG